MFLRGSVLKLVSHPNHCISAAAGEALHCVDHPRGSLSWADMNRVERTAVFFWLDQWWMDDLTRSPGGWFFCRSMWINGGSQWWVSMVDDFLGVSRRFP